MYSDTIVSASVVRLYVFRVVSFVCLWRFFSLTWGEAFFYSAKVGSQNNGRRVILPLFRGLLFKPYLSAVSS